MSGHPTLHQKAPAISLQDQNGVQRDSADFKGSWVLVYFYPKDDTPGCTVEACGLRDKFAELKKEKVIVLGISADPPASHQKFIKKYELPFLLLADTEKAVCKAYGVWGTKKFMGREFMGISRTSFLMDPQGNIAKIYEKVSPETHAEEVLKDVRSLKK